MPRVVISSDAAVVSAVDAARSHARRLKASARAFRPVAIQRDNWWVVSELPAGWRICYRLAVQHGRLVVAELRILPIESGYSEDEWSGTYVGVRAQHVPIGGLTSTVLRQVRIGAHITDGRHVLRRVRGRGGAQLRRELEKLGVRFLDDRPANHEQHVSRGLQDAIRAYADAVARGSRRPVADAAETLKLAPSQVRDFVYRARRMGYLTETQPKRYGGMLTPTGERALARKDAQ